MSSEFEKIKLEHDYLSSSEKLLEYQSLYFEDDLIQKKIQNIKIYNKKKEKIIQGNKIILVTSAFHMPRAQMLFEKEGLEVVPYPVDFKSLTTDSVTFMDYLPNGQSLAKTDMGMRELIGRLFYWLKFMIN